MTARHRKDGESGMPAAKRGSKYSEGMAARPSEPIGYNELDAEKLRFFVDAITRDGCAVVLSRTSDGGALAITLLDGDYRAKEYANSIRQAYEIMDAWVKISLG